MYKNTNSVKIKKKIGAFAVNYKETQIMVYIHRNSQNYVFKTNFDIPPNLV